MLLKDYEKGQSLKGVFKSPKTHFFRALPTDNELLRKLIEGYMMSDTGGSIYCGVDEKTLKVQGLITNARKLKTFVDRVKELFPSKSALHFYHFVAVPIRQSSEEDFQTKEEKNELQVIEIHVQPHVRGRGEEGGRGLEGERGVKITLDG